MVQLDISSSISIAKLFPCSLFTYKSSTLMRVFFSCTALGTIMSEVLDAEQCFSLKDLKVNGYDIIGLGVEQGKIIGKILNALLDGVISEAVENTREALLQKAVEYIE